MKSRSDFRMNAMDFQKLNEDNSVIKKWNKKKIAFICFKYIAYLIASMLIIITSGFLESKLHKWIGSTFFIN